MTSSMSTAGELSARPTTGEDSGGLTLADVYAKHTDFLWKTLHRLGVREPHIEDVLQEVLLVVHRRLDSYDRRSALTTWLFGVCLRVASDHRKRAHFRRERAMADVAMAAGVVAR